MSTTNVPLTSRDRLALAAILILSFMAVAAACRLLFGAVMWLTDTALPAVHEILPLWIAIPLDLGIVAGVGALAWHDRRRKRDIGHADIDVTDDDDDPTSWLLVAGAISGLVTGMLLAGWVVSYLPNWFSAAVLAVTFVTFLVRQRGEL